MEHHGQHGHATDKVEKHGQPVPQPVAQVQPTRDDHKTDGVLRRSGSSSSSSSEDDGVGGRRKKGMKDKIKEKLPGGAHKDAAGQQHTPAAGEYAGTGAHGAKTTGEKKGIMEKVKEKLPGGQQ